MRLTEKDIKLFEALSKSNLGKELLDYLNRLRNYLCDIRTMEGVEENKRQARLEFDKLLEKHLIQKIKTEDQAKKEKINQYI